MHISASTPYQHFGLETQLGGGVRAEEVLVRPHTFLAGKSSAFVCDQGWLREVQVGGREAPHLQGVECLPAHLKTPCLCLVCFSHLRTSESSAGGHPQLINASD